MRAEARQTLITELQALLSAEFSDFDVFYENGPGVDYGQQTRPFVEIVIDLQDSRPASLEAAPMTRYLMDVVVACRLKRGEGTTRLDALLDRVSQTLKNRYLGTLLMQSPKPYRLGELNGWYGRAVRVPFTYDELA